MTIDIRTVTVKGVIKADIETDLGLTYTGDNTAQIADEFEVFAIGAATNALTNTYPNMVGNIEVRYSTMVKGGKIAAGTFEAFLFPV